MADNYLGRKMEEYEAQKCASVRTRRVSLVSLLTKNRSTRGFDTSFKVREDQLISLVEAARLAPTAMNQQALRYRLVTEEARVSTVLAFANSSALFATSG